MIWLLLGLTAAAPSAAPSPAMIDHSRKALVTCLKQAASSAKPTEVKLDGFAAYAKAQCAAQESALLDAMVSFDMKNGVSRKSATEGAQMAVDDYVETARNNYAMRTEN